MPRIAARRLLALVPAEADADLLGRFAQSRDEGAFAELVRRHGGLVRGTARRVLGDPHAADDVFQAAFLLLARKAGAGGWGPTVGPWLYQAAWRLARKARTARARRPNRPGPAADAATVSDPTAALGWAEVRAAIDAELGRLPAAYRDPLVLCYLDGLTRDEAAAALGCSADALKGRLERGRAKLRARLGRRGLDLSAGLAAIVATGAGVGVGEAAAVARRAALLHASGPAAVGRFVAAVFGSKPVAAAVVLVAAVAFGSVMTAPSPQPPAAATPPADPPPPAVATADALGDPLPAGAIARLGTLRFRPGGSVEALAVSPDGTRVASWAKALYKHDQFSLWEAATGKELRAVRTREGTLAALTWTPDGRGLAVLKAEQVSFGSEFVAADLRVWEFTAENPEPLPPGAGGPTGFTAVQAATSFDGVAVSPDGKLLAVTVRVNGKPAKVRVYALAPTPSLAREKPTAEWDAPPAVCKTLQFTPDGRHLVGVGRPAADPKKTAGTVVVWDAKTGAIANTFDTPPDALQWGDFAAAATTGRVAVGLADGNVFVADLLSGTGATIKAGHKQTGETQGAGVFALDFSRDGKLIASVGQDGMVRVWHFAGEKLAEFGPHRSTPQAVAFAPDRKRLYSGGQDGLVRVWDITTGKETGPAGGHPHWLWRVSASADGSLVLTEANDGLLRLWDGRTGAVRRTIPAGGTVTAAKLAPDGRRVVAVVGGVFDPNKTLKVWDAASGADATPAGFPKPLTAGGFLFTPDGSVLVTHFDDKLAAWVWSEKPGGPAPGTKLWAADMPPPGNPANNAINYVSGVTVAPDGKHLVTAAYRSWYREEKGLRFGYGGEGVVDLWDAATGKRVRRVAESPVALLGPPVYTADGNLIHSGGGTFPQLDGSSVTTESKLCTVDPLTGRIVREFALPPDPGVNSGHAACLSADGKVLFRSTAGGAVQAFEVATGAVRAVRPGHRDTVMTLDAPAADPRRLVSGSQDTTALVWDVGFGGAKGEPLTEAKRAELWAALGDADGARGYAAMQALAADPAGFVALAGAKLKPAPAGPSAAELEVVFGDLASDDFAVREAASKKLDGYGEAAAGPARERLRGEASAEARARLARFLGRPVKLQEVRAVELLEHLGTPEAAKLLGALAAGGPARLTADAAGAARRLAARAR